MCNSTPFQQLSKYAPYFVSNPRDEMSRFVIRASNDLVEVCHSKILHDNMYISKLMVHDQQVKEIILKSKNREFKRAKSYERGTSKSILKIKDKPRINKRVYNKVPSNFPKSNKDRVSNPKS